MRGKTQLRYELRGSGSLCSHRLTELIGEGKRSRPKDARHFNFTAPRTTARESPGHTVPSTSHLPASQPSRNASHLALARISCTPFAASPHNSFMILRYVPSAHCFLRLQVLEPIGIVKENSKVRLVSPAWALGALGLGRVRRSLQAELGRAFQAKGTAVPRCEMQRCRGAGSSGGIEASLVPGAGRKAQIT